LRNNFPAAAAVHTWQTQDRQSIEPIDKQVLRAGYHFFFGFPASRFFFSQKQNAGHQSGFPSITASALSGDSEFPTFNAPLACNSYTHTTPAVKLESPCPVLVGIAARYGLSALFPTSNLPCS
jgi:hypothetical protein